MYDIYECEGQIKKLDIKASDDRDNPKDTFSLTAKVYEVYDEDVEYEPGYEYCFDEDEDDCDYYEPYYDAGNFINNLLDGETFSLRLASLDEDGEEVKVITLQENHPFSDDMTLKEMEKLKTKVAKDQEWAYHKRKGDLGDILKLKIDFDKGELRVDSDDMDLSGLTAPIRVSFMVGGEEEFACTAFDENEHAFNADVINGSKLIPSKLITTDTFPEALTVKKATVEAGEKRGIDKLDDEIKLSGKIDTTFEAFENNTAVNLYIWAPAPWDADTEIVFLERSIDIDTYLSEKKQRFKIKKSKSDQGKLSFEIDFDKSSYKLKLEDCGLSGLYNTLNFEIDFDSSVYEASIGEDILNGKDDVPFVFLADVADALVLDKVKISAGDDRSSPVDKVKISGDIGMTLDHLASTDEIIVVLTSDGGIVNEFRISDMSGFSSSKRRLKFKGNDSNTPDTSLELRVDLKKYEFSFEADDCDLTGLSSPFVVSLYFNEGSDTLVEIASEVDGDLEDIPFLLSQRVDGLQINKFSLNFTEETEVQNCENYEEYGLQGYGSGSGSLTLSADLFDAPSPVANEVISVRIELEQVLANNVVREYTHVQIGPYGENYEEDCSEEDEYGYCEFEEEEVQVFEGTNNVFSVEHGKLGSFADFVEKVCVKECDYDEDDEDYDEDDCYNECDAATTKMVHVGEKISGEINFNKQKLNLSVKNAFLYPVIVEKGQLFDITVTIEGDQGYHFEGTSSAIYSGKSLVELSDLMDYIFNDDCPYEYDY